MLGHLGRFERLRRFLESLEQVWVAALAFLLAFLRFLGLFLVASFAEGLLGFVIILAKFKKDLGPFVDLALLCQRAFGADVDLRWLGGF